MPIRFACPTCGQRLKVESRKAGRTSTCPKCKGPITVPEKAKAEATTESESPPGEEEPAEEEAPSFDFDPGIEVVYETGVTPATRSSRKKRDEDSDLDRIGIPRYVIFVQGILLTVVGLVCFLLGMAVGGAVSEHKGPTTNVPVNVSGTVAIASQGNRNPDASAVVIFIPLDAAPSERGTLEGIRPGDDPAQGVKVRDYLQSLGGGVSKCDARGQYSLKLPDRGRYYLLAISASSKASPNAPINPAQVAQISKFFDLSSDPLTGFRYQWRMEGLRGDQRANVTFD